MTKVFINSQEVCISFNLATELAYEELTDSAFIPKDILEEIEKHRSKKIINVAIACLIANDSPIPSDYILKSATRNETSELAAAVVKEMLAWLGVPAMAESSDKTEEGDAKNS